MAYATEADAIAIYGTDYVTVSADKDGDGSIDTALFAAALDRATSIINGKLAGRVALPLVTVPDDLMGYCVDLAIYYASVTCDVMTDQKREMHKGAISALDSMAKNMTSMGQEDPPDNGPQSASYASEDRVFNRTSLDRLF